MRSANPVSLSSLRNDRASSKTTSTSADGCAALCECGFSFGSFSKTDRRSNGRYRFPESRYFSGCRSKSRRVALVTVFRMLGRLAVGDCFRWPFVAVIKDDLALTRGADFATERCLGSEVDARVTNAGVSFTSAFGTVSPLGGAFSWNWTCRLGSPSSAAGGTT